MSFVVSLIFSKYVMVPLLIYAIIQAALYALGRISSKRKAQLHMENARQRRELRDRSVKRFLEENKFPDDNKKEQILGLKDLSEIRNALETKRFTSEEITMTYIYQAATKGLEMESIADINFEWAKNEAIKCDQERAQGKLRGPLHGIPISVKDTVHLEGTVSTNGLTSKSNNVIKKDGIISRALKLNGAIPFVKSNIPTLLMLPESWNRIFGAAKNYHDYSRVSIN